EGDGGDPAEAELVGEHRDLVDGVRDAAARTGRPVAVAGAVEADHPQLPLGGGLVPPAGQEAPAGGAVVHDQREAGGRAQLVDRDEAMRLGCHARTLVKRTATFAGFWPARDAASRRPPRSRADRPLRLFRLATR